jgi:hypothetical protein
MYYRAKFVTNSSSTCFIAYGVYARANDPKRYDELAEADIYEDGPVGIARTYMDEGSALFYIKASELPAFEYGIWQPIGHKEIDEVAALTELKKAVTKYGFDMDDSPAWGFYNSGH